MTIEPMKTDDERRILIPDVLCALAVFAIIWLAPKAFDTLMDRLEHQKEARNAYYYEHYGDAIEKWETERRNK